MSARSINLADILEQMADSVPDRLALVTDEQEFTYAQLDERATRNANALKAMGVRPGDHVAVHATNRVEWVESFFGCFKARAVPININYRYVRKELQHVYSDSGCVMSIVAPEYVDAVEEIRDSLPALKHLLVMGEDYEKALQDASSERSNEARSGDDHYIIFTGGTTGLPKGVVWRQEDIVHAALNALRYGAPLESVEKLGADAAANETPVRMLTAGPLMHGGSQWILGNCLVAGATYIMYTRRSYDAEAYLDLAEKSKANSLTVLGDAMARPVADAIEAQPDRWDLSNIFVVSNGAAPLSEGVRAQLRGVFPNRIINDSYGASESGATATQLDDGKARTAPVFAVGPDVAVVDANMRRVEPGEVGMLARSGHIPLGYLNDPEKTARTFKEFDGKRWAIPGDAARLEEDGTITMLGRGSTTINTGGEKVHPEEVEGVLMEHPDVYDAAVVGTPHERWGEQVTALVRLRDGADVTVEDLDRHVREQDRKSVV